ncbi:MAG: hypothetical protein N2V72_00320 [Methanophagales archaeon]|nr:hypothetical protein [Methanophagales archaeon]
MITLIGIAETVEREEIEPFEEKFKEMVEFFYQNEIITEEEYKELLKQLKKQGGERKRKK